MKSSVRNDYKRRQLFLKYELVRLLLKSLLHNRNLPKLLRFKFQFELSALPRNSSLVRVHNRCIITGRAHGVYKFCKLSRIQLKEYGSQGKITGLRKASW